MDPRGVGVTAAHEDAMTVPCPYCGSPAGDRCRLTYPDGSPVVDRHGREHSKRAPCIARLKSLAYVPPALDAGPREIPDITAPRYETSSE
jgi:hypothetical protein